MKKGFTLSELLMALTIVGIIAVLTVPVMMNNVQNRLFATQVKNFAADIEQFAQDQLIVHKTRDLFDTDFAEPSKLLTNGHFSIAKICTENKSLTDCWKTEAVGKNKITYKRLNGQSWAPDSGTTLILKNGLMFKYINQKLNNEPVITFVIDINGNDKPNIIGRDVFTFHITSKGHVVDIGQILNDGTTIDSGIQKCKSGATKTGDWCYFVLSNNSWKMDY